LPAREQYLLLRRGDMLNLTRDCSPAPVDAEDISRIGCTLPEVFDNAAVGEKIHFDDGRIGGEIVAVDRDMLRVRSIMPRPKVPGYAQPKASTCRIPGCRYRP
jgi:pyruvate kinase